MLRTIFIFENINILIMTLTYLIHILVFFRLEINFYLTLRLYTFYFDLEFLSLFSVLAVLCISTNHPFFLFFDSRVHKRVFFLYKNKYNNDVFYQGCCFLLSKIVTVYVNN